MKESSGGIDQFLFLLEQEPPNKFFLYVVRVLVCITNLLKEVGFPVRYVLRTFLRDARVKLP